MPAEETAKASQMSADADGTFGDNSPIEDPVVHSKTAAEEAEKAKRACDQIFHQYQDLLYKYSIEVPYLQQEVYTLSTKLNELERWKNETLFQMRQLREKHKDLRRKLGEEEQPDLNRAKTTVSENVKRAPKEEEPEPVPVSRSVTVPPQLPSQVAADLESDSGLQISKGAIDGKETQKAVWRITSLSQKLRGAMGRPVVSPAFKMWNHEEIRLMVMPAGQEGAQGPRTRQEKEKFTRMVTDGPLNAQLKLKVPSAKKVILTYFLTVGKKEKGPFEHDFSVTAINGCGDFDVDWIKEAKDQNFTVSVEMFEPPLEEGASPA